MYENVTYEVILDRMLDRVLAQNPNIDTREGSIIYNALAPAAVELQNMYIQLDTILNESFADTQTRDYLIRRCAERGVNVEPATYAIRQGEFVPSTLEIAIGTRFSLNLLNYVVVEKISDGIYKLQCETAGYDGNVESGTLIPIEYIEGLQTATLTEVLVPGEDEEDTEHLRQRYFDSLDSQAFGGNIKDYKEKTNSLDGVGGVKVYPVWNGGGTVKLVIINSDFDKPSDVLINSVQTAIDPTQNQGTGVGIAPIGHIVTVVGCGETSVDVTTKITFQKGWDWEALKPYAEQAIDDYFKELASDWASSDNIIVRISQIEIRLLNLTGVLDIADTTLNGIAHNLTIDADNIPIRGEVSNV
jgi:uncharacterized phage protein gp47/JayE|nr:MAG TPA: Baseplate J like protein [Caudoviricetes sp.]